MYRLLLAALVLALSAGCAAEPTSGTKKPAKGKTEETDTDAGAGNKPVVVMKTSMGTIKVELYPDKAPITVRNFHQYVDNKFFDGTIFHRVIGLPHGDHDFMIQGGGFEPGLAKVTTPQGVREMERKKGLGEPIKNEAGNGMSNKRGTIAMARTPDPDSATAQFFINVADNRSLDRDNPKGDGFGYCVFGKVIEGMDVVDKIKAVKTKTLFRGFSDVPVEDVVIESIRRERKN
jgi:cyclophilin family peptidyl-prolyl cis-trans isomerase